MTVKELKEKLADVPDDYTVIQLEESRGSNTWREVVTGRVLVSDSQRNVVLVEIWEDE